jgi:AcrR family transcriptional regulator
MTTSQRQRIARAMAATVSEQGFAAATVSAVCTRANVSRRTFYTTFEGREDCLLDVIDEGYRRTRPLIASAFDRADTWQAGVRAALAALLALFDDEPLLARAWFVETVAAGSWALERRERHVAKLTSMIVERWSHGEPDQFISFSASLVMASVIGIIQTHLLRNREQPLICLLEPLMGTITALYLDAPAAAAEARRASALTAEILAGRRVERRTHRPAEFEIPRIVRDPRAHRARACLCHLLTHSGSSNREVARAVGIARDTQISTLLARLHRAGLLVKHRAAPGGANAWSLSPYGVEIARATSHSETHRVTV